MAGFFSNVLCMTDSAVSKHVRFTISRLVTGMFLLIFPSISIAQTINTLTVEELKWLSENSEIRVGVDPDATPFEFIEEDGSIGGVAGDYLDILAQKLNVEFVWSENQNWDEAMRHVRSGEAHILSTATATNERRTYLDFVELYPTIGSSIFIKSGAQHYNSLERLKGRKIAQITSFAETEFIQTDYPEIEIIEVSTFSEALHMISSGDADAHIGNMMTGLEIINNEGLNNLIVVGESPFQGSSNIAVRKDLPLLSSSLEKAIATITEEQHDAISQKWLAIPLSSEIDYALVWRIVLVSALILMITILWAMSLRREVKRRILAEQQMAVLKTKAEEAQNLAEFANKAKSDFIANLSHEIRTPLNSMMVFSEAMSDGLYGDISHPKYKEYLENIQKGGKHLEHVIADILDLSKIEAEKWQLVETEFDLVECVVDALQILQGKADKKNIKLSLNLDGIEPPFNFYGENISIRRIIINLLSNAIKFTNNNGEVVLSLARAESNEVLLKVEDNGIGIRKSEIPNVLEPFGQAGNDVFTKEAGTGLGLPIVKKLAELHDGKLTLESELSVGTTATVSLPAGRVR